MPKQIEVLDRLPGCGKTKGIIDYMVSQHSTNWLYISPLVSEVDKVAKDAEQHGVVFYTPSKDDDHKTLSASVLSLLKQGVNIACTHELTHRFTTEHLQALHKNNYAVVCDETLDLIEPYKMAQDDFKFLTNHNLMSVNPDSGRVSFNDQLMGDEAKYSSFKKLCDIGCMYAAKRSDSILVTQVSTDMIELSSRFIISTHNYENSMMQVFLSIHGFTHKPMQGITTRYTNAEQKAYIKKNLELLEPLGVRKLWDKPGYSLSSYWWNKNSTETQKREVLNAMITIKRKYKLNKEDFFFTLPKGISEGKNGFKPSSALSTESWVACNTRATNEYADRTLAMHAYNLFANQGVVSYLQDQGVTLDNNLHALNMLLQWLYRGCIRNQQPMKLVLLSKRMNELLKNWLENDSI